MTRTVLNMQGLGNQMTGSDEEQIGLLEAKSAAAFFTKVFKEFMTFEDARALLTKAASKPETVDEWLRKFTECEKMAEERGMALPDGKGGRRMMNFWHFTNAKRQFIHHMLVDFNGRINSISDTGRMAVFVDEDFIYFPFHDFNPTSLIYSFLHHREGILATVSGAMGSGKTDFTLFVAEQLLKAEDVTFHVVTNIWLTVKTLEEHPTLHYRSDMRGLLLQLCDCVDMDGQAILAMDETAMFFSRREPGRKENIQFEKFIRLIRKYNASMLLIDQMQEGLPGAALDLRTVVYHKEGKKKLHYSSVMGDRSYNLYLKGVPRTALGFDTKHMGYFDFNVDLDKLYDSIKGRDDPVQATRDFLDAPAVARPTTNRELILDFITQNGGCIAADMVAPLGLDKSAVSKYVAAMVDEGLIEPVPDGRKVHLYPLKGPLRR